MAKKPSLKQFARFSEDVYKIPSINSFLPEEDGWRVFRDMYPEFQVLDTFARVYIRNNNQECDVVVSYRGTETGFNWVTNIDTFLLSNIPEAFSRGVEPFFRNLTIEITYQIEGPSWISCNYHFTGHSLGAGLAEISSVKFHHPATTFDSPGIYDYVLKRIEEGQLSQNDLTYGQNNIFSVLSVPNAVNTARKHLGNFVSLNHDNADMIISSNINSFTLIKFASSYTKEYSHRMDLISSMIKEGAEKPSIYSSFTNWPVTLQKDVSIFTLDYTGFQYFISYNHNPYFFEKLYFKWSESPEYDPFVQNSNLAIHDNAVRCRFQDILGQTSIDPRECLTRGGHSEITDINPGISIYGDNSGVKFTGGTNFNDRYFGGTGDDIYYIFYGDDTIVDQGGVNTYQLLPEIRGMKVIEDRGMKNGIIRLGNFDVTGEIKTITKSVTETGSQVDFEYSNEGFIFTEGFKKYIKIKTSTPTQTSRRLLSEEDSRGQIAELFSSIGKNPAGKVTLSNFTSGDFGIITDKQNNHPTFTFINYYSPDTQMMHVYGVYDPSKDAIYVPRTPLVYDEEARVPKSCKISPSSGVDCQSSSLETSFHYINSEGQMLLYDPDSSNSYGFFVRTSNGYCSLDYGFSSFRNFLDIFTAIRGSSSINYFIDYDEQKAILRKTEACNPVKSYIFNDLDLESEKIYANPFFEASIDILSNGDVIVFISKNLNIQGESKYKNIFYYKVFDQNLNIKIDNIFIDERIYDLTGFDQKLHISKLDFNFDNSNMGYLVYYMGLSDSIEDYFNTKIAYFDIYNGQIKNIFNTDPIVSGFFSQFQKFIFDPETIKFYLVSMEVLFEELPKIKTINIVKLDPKTGHYDTEIIYKSDNFIMLFPSLSIFEEKFYAITFFEKKGDFVEGKTIFYDTQGSDEISEYDLIQGNPDLASIFGCKDSSKITCIAISNGMSDKLEASLGKSAVLFGSEGVKNDFIIHPGTSQTSRSFRIDDLFKVFAGAKSKISDLSSKLKQTFDFTTAKTYGDGFSSEISTTNLQNTQNPNTDIVISYFDSNDVLDLTPLINSGYGSFELLNNGNLSEIMFPNGNIIKVTPSINTPPFVLQISVDGTAKAEIIQNFTDFTPTRDVFDIPPSNSSDLSGGMNALSILGICIGIIGFLSFIFYIGHKKFGFNYNCFNNNDSNLHDELETPNPDIQSPVSQHVDMVELSGSVISGESSTAV